MTDYITQGPGYFVLMHIIRLNGYYDALDLTEMLGKGFPVWYCGQTARIEFFWPGSPTNTDAASQQRLSTQNDAINQALNRFMQRCDAIAFHADRQLHKGVVGVEHIDSFPRESQS